MIFGFKKITLSVSPFPVSVLPNRPHSLHPALVIRIHAVCFHCTYAQEQRICNFLCGFFIHNQLQDFFLAALVWEYRKYLFLTHRFFQSIRSCTFSECIVRLSAHFPPPIKKSCSEASFNKISISTISQCGFTRQFSSKKSASPLSSPMFFLKAFRAEPSSPFILISRKTPVAVPFLTLYWLPVNYLSQTTRCILPLQ